MAYNVHTWFLVMKRSFFLLFFHPSIKQRTCNLFTFYFYFLYFTNHVWRLVTFIRKSTPPLQLLSGVPWMLKINKITLATNPNFFTPNYVHLQCVGILFNFKLFDFVEFCCLKYHINDIRLQRLEFVASIQFL